jgi:hypothetical protein
MISKRTELVTYCLMHEEGDDDDDDDDDDGDVLEF